MKRAADQNTTFRCQNVFIGYEAGYNITGDDVVMIRDKPKNTIPVCDYCGAAKMEAGDPHKCANCGAVVM